MAQDRLSAGRFLIEQLFRAVGNRYVVTLLDADEAVAGDSVVFARQKLRRLKEDIRFFADEEETEELFRIKAHTIFEAGGQYDVLDPDGLKIGQLDHTTTSR